MRRRTQNILHQYLNALLQNMDSEEEEEDGEDVQASGEEREDMVIEEELGDDNNTTPAVESEQNNEEEEEDEHDAEDNNILHLSSPLPQEYNDDYDSSFDSPIPPSYTPQSPSYVPQQQQKKSSPVKKENFVKKFESFVMKQVQQLQEHELSLHIYQDIGLIDRYNLTSVPIASQTKTPPTAITTTTTTTTTTNASSSSSSSSSKIAGEGNRVHLIGNSKIPHMNSKNVFHNIIHRQHLIPHHQKSAVNHASVFQRKLHHKYIPNTNHGRIDAYDYQVFCGQFSKDGSVFMSACQDQIIRLYKTEEIIHKQLQRDAISRYYKEHNPNNSQMGDDDDGIDLEENYESEEEEEEEQDEEVIPQGGGVLQQLLYRLMTGQIRRPLNRRNVRRRRTGHYGGTNEVAPPGNRRVGFAKPFKTIYARDVSWSVVDCHYSPDQRAVIYSSWSPNIYFCTIYDDGLIKKHEAFPLNPNSMRFCAFSIKFSPDSNEILAGASDYHLYIYDINAQKRVLKVSAHEDDINSVCFADEKGGNIFVSGSDDCLMKVWDRRCISNDKPVGYLVGHCDGVTCVSPKGDGTYFISNSKDQHMKLWDIRKMTTEMDASKSRYVRTRINANATWDYRYQKCPLRNQCQIHPYDTSIMTYTGHKVLQTLIRCYFSPAITTGQKYVYTGSYDGSIYIYDVLTGNLVRKLSKYHSNVVRDVSWHPYEPLLFSTSWDHTVQQWSFQGNVEQFHTDSNSVRTNLNQNKIEVVEYEEDEENFAEEGYENDEDYIFEEDTDEEQ